MNISEGSLLVEGVKSICRIQFLSLQRPASSHGLLLHILSDGQHTTAGGSAAC